MLKDFKEFALKGNVLDLAVGVIIGGAFGKIVSSLVADLIMPTVGILMGSIDFTNLFINLTNTPYATLEEAKKAGAATINYGVFLNNIVDFLIISFSIFLVIRQINRFKKAPAAAAPSTKECPQCLSQVPLKAKRCAFCTSELPNA